jgi:methyl-accepting chemotaxis protein
MLGSSLFGIERAMPATNGETVSTSITFRKRLALSFGCIGFFLLVLAALAYWSITSTTSGLVSLTEERLPRLAMINEAKFRLNQIGLSMRNMALLREPAAIAAQKEQVLKERNAIGDVLKRLDAVINTEKGKALMAKILEARANYIPAQEGFMARIADGKPEEATAYLLSTARPLQLAYFAAMDEFITFQNELVKKASDEANASARLSKSIIAIVSLVGLGVTVVVGLSTIRSTLRQLGAEPNEALRLVSAVAQGDLTSSVALRSGDTSSLMAEMMSMQQNLARLITQVGTGAASVATASAQIAQGNQDMSQRTEEQASALQQTAATMEELGVTVRNNAESAAQANQMAQAASMVALQGGEVVGEVVNTMQGITDSSKKIGDIIGVIDGIAFQTNILALNAAVEAARAGEAGRGFAVVAGEVRILAQRSADAAKEIKGLIGRSVQQVEQGTGLVDKAGRTMQEIVDAISRVTDIVGEISSASAEQSRGIQQVGEAVGQMDQVTQQNAALVEEIAAASESQRQTAQELVQCVAVFKT